MDLMSFIPDMSAPGGWVYFFLIVLASSATPVPIFSTEIVVALAGTAANPVLVGVVAGVASSIGELSTYFIGIGGQKAIGKKRKWGERYEQARGFFKKWGFWAVIAFAFTPLPMDLIGLIAGGLRYDIKRFFIATMIGKIPRNIIIAYVGATGLNFFF